MWQEAIDTIMSGDILLGIFQVIMALVVTIVNLILYPFSLLINQFVPDLDQALAALAGYFNYAGTYMGWLLNALAIPGIVVTMIAAYYLFSYSTTFGAWAVKLMVKWKQAIWR